MSSQAFDSVQPVETPEGVDLALSPAGPCPRGLAWAIDASIRWFAYGAISLLLSFLGSAGTGLFLVFMFLLEWFYPVFFEVYRSGQTPGKAVLGLAVVMQDGTPVGFGASVIRNLLQFADFLPFAYLAGVVSTLTTERFQRLGDLAAGTQVVHRPSHSAMRERPRPRPGLTPRPLPIPLELHEQRAVLDFLDRRASLNPDRAEELARLAEPLAGEERAADNLCAFALWLEGQRPTTAGSPEPRGEH